MSDLDDAANGKLTTSGPSEPDGVADVSATARYCSRCDRYVEPVGKGACPICFAFLPKNSAARRHPISVSRRKALFAENVAEYKPDTLLLRRVCRKVANIEERLESVKEGTPEHQRLIAMSSELTAILEASRAREIRATDTDLAALTDDQLIERTTTILRSLLDARDEQRKSEAFLAAAAGLPVLTAAGPAGEAVASTVVPAPGLDCPSAVEVRRAPITSRGLSLVRSGRADETRRARDGSDDEANCPWPAGLVSRMTRTDLLDALAALERRLNDRLVITRIVIDEQGRELHRIVRSTQRPRTIDPRRENYD